MERFLERCGKYSKDMGCNITRLALAKGEDAPHVLELQPSTYCQNTYSVSKTFTMTAIGLLWDRGLLRLSDKVCDILRKYVPKQGMDARWEEVTVELALTHKAGLPGGHLDIDVAPAGLFGFDYLDYTFRTELLYDPGTSELYSDGAFYLLSRVVSELVGMPMDTYLWKELFYPLGYREMAWSRCPQGYPMGATGLYVGVGDIAKLGQVYLNGGMYGGKRILSEEWCQMAPERNYALHWDKTHTYYAKGGMLGQVIAVYPGAGLSVAMQSCGGDPNKVLGYIARHLEEL